MGMIEKVARAIATENGDDLDQIPQTKTEWNMARGVFAGRVRDINEPFRSDYFDLARAAITALMEPSEGMLIKGGVQAQDFYSKNGSHPRTKAVWQAMLSAALEE